MRVDASHRGESESLQAAVTVHLPDDGAIRGPLCFAFPGSSYTRAYFDMKIPGHPGFSMAEYFNSLGLTLVACDHIGAGDSTLPAKAPPDLVAASNHCVVTRVRAILKGRAEPDVAKLACAPVVGIGHSMGGHLVTRQQANHGSFGAIAVLGWSAQETRRRNSDGEPMTADALAQLGLTGERPEPQRSWPGGLPPGYDFESPRSDSARWFFYPDDLPAAVVAADEAAVGPVAPAVHQNFPTPGFGRDAAAKVDVPVFLAFGAREVTADAGSEPKFYPGAPEITLVRLAGSSHCHNFAPDRHRLWERLARWCTGHAG